MNRKKLPRVERNIAILHKYASGSTLQQIADEYHITRQRVQQIVSKRQPMLDRHRQQRELYASYIQDFLEIMSDQKASESNQVPQVTSEETIAAKLIRAVNNRGGFIRLEGEKVIVNPTAAAMPLRDVLIAHREQIIDLLRTRGEPLPFQPGAVAAAADRDRSPHLAMRFKEPGIAEDYCRRTFPTEEPDAQR